MSEYLPSRLKVLVADDDPISRSLVASSLARMDVDVVEVEDGESAWVQLRKGNFSAAFLDLEMPGFDGFEIISCVRGHPATKHIPIVVITSRDDKRAIDRAQQSGATSYITKPVHWSAFRTHIGYLLDLMRNAKAAPAPGPSGRDGEKHSVMLAQLVRRLEVVSDAFNAGGAGAEVARVEMGEIVDALRRLALEMAPHSSPAVRPEATAA